MEAVAVLSSHSSDLAHPPICHACRSFYRQKKKEKKWKMKIPCAPSPYNSSFPPTLFSTLLSSLSISSEMMEETTSSRKRPDNAEFNEDVEPAKRPCIERNDELQAIDEDDDVSSLLIEEEMVNEVMKRLEEEIVCPCFSPPSLNLIHSKNEESCGPSFSDSNSSVMASIDIGGCSSNTSYFYGVSDESELSGLPFVSPLTDSGSGVAGTEADVCGFDGSWFFDEDDGFLAFGLESLMGGNDLAGANCGNGDGGVGADGNESEQEWLARALDGALLEFEE